jgi:hypothetical protein
MCVCMCLCVYVFMCVCLYNIHIQYGIQYLTAVYAVLEVLLCVECGLA